MRDYLERIGWNKQPPGPELPADVVAATRSKYREAYRLLTGHEFELGSQPDAIPAANNSCAERATVKDQLESLVGQMVERGILFDEAVNEFEKKFIKRVLDRSNGNQSRAARLLGIHRNTLSRKIDLYKIDHRTPEEQVTGCRLQVAGCRL